MKNYKAHLNEARKKSKLLKLKDNKGKTVTGGYYITSKGKTVQVTDWKGGVLVINDGRTIQTFDDPTDPKLKPFDKMTLKSVFLYNNGTEVSVGDIFVQYGHRFSVDKIENSRDLIHTSQIFDDQITKQKPIKLRGVTSKRFNGGDIVQAGKK